jgi:hypothetical protein
MRVTISERWSTVSDVVQRHAALELERGEAHRDLVEAGCGTCRGSRAPGWLSRALPEFLEHVLRAVGEQGDDLAARSEIEITRPSVCLETRSAVR